METERLDALVVRLPENVLLLSGYWPICGWAYAVLSQAGEASCIIPDTEEKEARVELAHTKLLTYPYGTKEPVDQLQEIRKAIESARGGRKWLRVGFEGSFETASPAWNAAESSLSAGPSRRMLEDVFGAEKPGRRHGAHRGRESRKDSIGSTDGRRGRPELRASEWTSSAPEWPAGQLAWSLRLQ